jgi:hypothetical protein
MTRFDKPSSPPLHLALLSLLAIAQSQVYAEQLWEIKGQHSIERADLVSRKDFSKQLVLELCKAFLDTHSESVARYIIATDEQDARQNLRKLGMTDWSFGSWRDAYNRMPRSLPPSAELLRVGHTASVRIYFGPEQRLEVPIRGKNGLHISFQQHTGQLLGLAMSSSGGHPGYVPHFFLQMFGVWPKEVAEAFSRQLRVQVRIPSLILSLEDSRWFAAHEDYVVMNRFLPFEPAPSLSVLKRFSRYYCNDSNGACSFWPPR